MNSVLGNLRNFDMNLLVVFMAVYEGKSFTQAARLLGKGQPAISNAIAKLRKILNDRLFLRCSRSLVTTAKADELAGILAASFEALSAAVYAQRGPTAQ